MRHQTTALLTLLALLLCAPVGAWNRAGHQVTVLYEIEPVGARYTGTDALRYQASVEADPEQIRADLVKMVRDEIGAVASFREVTVVGGLPKTRSGKILRKTMREIADGKDAQVPSTIEDASVLDRLRPVLRPE